MISGKVQRAPLNKKSEYFNDIRGWLINYKIRDLEKETAINLTIANIGILLFSLTLIIFGHELPD